MKKLITLCIALCTLFAVHAEELTIHFQVNMSKENLLESDKVYVVMGYSDWPEWSNSYEMTDADQDGIYTYTLKFNSFGGEVVQPYFYSYGNKDDFPLDEEVNGSCGTSDWIRSITIAETDTVATTPLYFFGSCNIDDGSTVDVIFQVDMSAFDGMNEDSYVAVVSDDIEGGPFSLFDDDGKGIYSNTITVPKNSTVSYRFAYAADELNLEPELVPLACATDSLRTFSVIESDMVLPVLAFGACADAAFVPHQLESAFDLYPNPCCSDVTIDFGGNALVRVYNSAGVQVLNMTKTEDVCAMEVSNLPKGLYLVTLRTGGNTLMKKLMIK